MTTTNDDVIVVSERAYKATAVFTTLACIALIVVGFLLVDAAIGWPTGGNADAPLALAGLATMLAAAGLYVFSLRFKTVEELEEVSTDG